MPKRLRIIRHLQADGTRMTIVDKIEAYSPGGHHHTKEHGLLAKRPPEAEATRMTTARMTMVMIVDEIVTTKKETRKNGGEKARTKQVISGLAKSSRETKDDG